MFSGCALIKANGQSVVAIIGGFYSPGMEIWNPSDGSVIIKYATIPPEVGGTTGMFKCYLSIENFCLKASWTISSIYKENRSYFSMYLQFELCYMTF